MTPTERQRSMPAQTRRGRLDRRRDRPHGQSLVEFAVVLPVFLLILAGILDFGLGLYSQMTIVNAAREGARLGVVDHTDATGVDVTAVDSRVQSMSGGLDKSQLTIDITCQHPDASSVSCSAAKSSDDVIVKVDYKYRMLWPLAFGNQLDLSSTVQMRIE